MVCVLFVSLSKILDQNLYLIGSNNLVYLFVNNYQVTVEVTVEVTVVFIIVVVVCFLRGRTR